LERIRIRIVATLLLAIAIGLLHAQESAAQLTGRVVDPSGASIKSATVILYQWNTETFPAVIREVARFGTDSFGEFAARVAPGKYDLLVSSDFSVPSAQRITVTSRPQRVSVRLSYDPDLPREACCDASVPTIPPPESNCGDACAPTIEVKPQN
jgi:hypothetical protein